MKTVFFVHPPAAGDHLTERLLRVALGDALRVCAFRDGADCCRSVPCRRVSEFDRVGYELLVQKCLDDGTLAPIKTNDFVLAQSREPTLRALEAYESDLKARGAPHSVEALQAWLADEAIRAVDFRRRWVDGTSRHFALKVEDLAAKPREILETVLSEIGVNPGDEALARAAGDFDPSGFAGGIDPRALEANPNFVRPYFAEFMNLLAEEAGYLGYPLWQERKPASGPVTTIYRARRALADGGFEAASELLGPFVAVNAVEPQIRAMLGEALLEAGREVEGRRALDTLLKARPDYFPGYDVLARHAYRLGLTIEARGVLREAASRRGGTEQVRFFLVRTKLDPDLLREFPGHEEPPVSREAVIAGFTWVLGRQPESEAVIDGHRRLHDDDDLRLSLLRSQEFREFHTRFEAGHELAPEGGAGVTRDDLLQAMRWILARPPRSRAEADTLLASPSPAALRLTLVGESEFRQSYPHLVELA